LGTSNTEALQGTFTNEEGLTILLEHSGIHAKWQANPLRIVVLKRDAADF